MMISRANADGSSAPNPRATIDLRDICRVLFRHKRKMLVFFCTTLFLVVVGLIVFPRTYTSSARLLVRIGKESVTLDPTATLNQTVNVEGSRESEINSELEILRSRVLLEDVVERLGPDVILASSPDGRPTWIQTILAPATIVNSWLSGGAGPSERAISRLEKTISVASPRKSSVIVVTCEARRPELAQRILQAFLDSYLVRHVTANRTSGSHAFFVDQSNLLGEQLEQATAQLRDAKNKTGLVSIEGQRANVQAEVNLIESAMLANQRALASSEAKAAALKHTLAALPEQLVAEETDAPSAAADAMRNELYKVQILEKEASSRYTSEHPRVIALRRQVAETQKIFDEQQSRRNQTTRKLSVVHQGVQTELAAAEALAAAQRAEAQSLQQQFDAVQAKIRELNENEFRIAELSRRAELLEISYRSYATNREQARIDQALESGRISNVNVVQPASLVAKASSPHVQLTMVLGLVMATLGAVLLAFAAEYFDQSLKTPEQIEQELGIPVLFCVPRGARGELARN